MKYTVFDMCQYGVVNFDMDINVVYVQKLLRICCSFRVLFDHWAWNWLIIMFIMIASHTCMASVSRRKLAKFKWELSGFATSCFDFIIFSRILWSAIWDVVFFPLIFIHFHCAIKPFFIPCLLIFYFAVDVNVASGCSENQCKAYNYCHIAYSFL